MNRENKDFLEMAFRSIQCFSNDGKLLTDELEELVTIALKDGTVDDNEKRILNNIFSRLTASDLTPDMLKKIEEIRSKYNV
ncbi:hypothetical protein MNBD_GAMMA09-2951 [hydrothermal vent metagenome]|uniref:Co-chaperone DjlA N-terminal domain-containing protein n=1 Tax=hydrothermal vent metagenome TaxID=652676 RepID=A0A3B0XU36_9ZZZZ